MNTTPTICLLVLMVLWQASCTIQIPENLDRHQKDAPTTSPPSLPVASVFSFSQTVPWQAAPGIADDRMLFLGEDDRYPSVFKTLWNWMGEPHLVIFRRADVDLFGSRFDCEVFNSQGRKVRSGIVECADVQAPYCLIEVKSVAAAPPIQGQDEWILCVGLTQSSWPVDPTKPTYFVNDGVEQPSESNQIWLQPIKWKKEDGSFMKGQVDRLADGPLSIRHAETVKIPATWKLQE